jgi:hypothetical protein
MVELLSPELGYSSGHSNKGGIPISRVRIALRCLEQELSYGLCSSWEAPTIRIKTELRSLKQVTKTKNIKYYRRQLLLMLPLWYVRLLKMNWGVRTDPATILVCLLICILYVLLECKESCNPRESSVPRYCCCRYVNQVDLSPSQSDGGLFRYHTRLPTCSSCCNPYACITFTLFITSSELRF